MNDRAFVYVAKIVPKPSEDAADAELYYKDNHPKLDSAMRA